MNDLNPGPAAPGALPRGASRSGRTKRLVTTVAASAVLLGSGAAIGIALTGGASASTGSAANTPAKSRPAAIAAARCAKLTAKLRKSDHPAAATRLRAYCDDPLLRLALVGGEHGQVTFRGKTGPKTLAFERGTVESVTSSAITVKALDGTTWTWDLTASTAVLEAGQRAARARLAAGDLVLVGGPVVSGVNDARLIRIHKAA